MGYEKKGYEIGNEIAGNEVEKDPGDELVFKQCCR